MFLKFLPVMLISAILLTGCEDKRVADPPIARAELTTRLYEALQYQRYEEALSIIEKLLASDPDDVELLEMQVRVISNIYTIKVQQAVDQGDLDTAMQIVHDGRKNHPSIRQFTDMEEEITALIELRDAAANLARAKTTLELHKALEVIELMDIDERYPHAVALKKDIAKRKQDLQKEIAAARARAAAEARAKAEAQARAEAAAKAKAEAEAKAAAEAKAKAEAEAKAAAEAKAKAEARKNAPDQPVRRKLIQPDPGQFVGPTRPRGK